MTQPISEAAKGYATAIAVNTDNASQAMSGPRFLFEEYVEEQAAVIQEAIDTATAADKTRIAELEDQCRYQLEELQHAQADHDEKAVSPEAIEACNDLITEQGEIISSLTADLAGLREATTWRPIATAPKDGTVIVCARLRRDGSTEVREDYWRKYPRPYAGEGFGYGAAGDWWTHWMPKPPKEDA